MTDTRPLVVVAELRFYADFPTDDNDADTHADTLIDGIREAVSNLPSVIAGSVDVPEFDTRTEAER